MAEPVLRRRKHKSDAAADLAEPLLGYESDEAASLRPEAGGSGRRRGGAGIREGGSTALVPYSINAYDWAALLRELVAGAVTGLRGLASTIGSYVSWLRQPRQQLTVAQAARLDELRRRIAVSYDGTDPEHQENLRALWAAAFPGEPLQGLKTERWKDMGWQGTDPGTDFRGAGLISLHNHLYMAAAHPAAFDALRHKRQGQRSEWEYPFAVAGVSLTFMLIEALDLRDDSRLPRTPAGRAFLRLLGDEDAPPPQPSVEQLSEPAMAAAAAAQPWAADHPVPLGELYVAAFTVLDRHWLAARANYMEFPAVLASTRKAVERALARGGGSLEDTLRRLHGS